MEKEREMEIDVGIKKFIVRDRIIRKVGLDTGVLVALADNDLLCLSKPRIFIKKGMCFVYQLVVNETINILIKRGYAGEEAISKTLDYLKENNITIIKEDYIDQKKRNFVYNDLKRQRNKIKVMPKPEDSDLDILASYKIANIGCIFTTNYKHFIELGKYLNMIIEGVYSEELKELKNIDGIWKKLFWKPRKKKSK